MPRSTVKLMLEIACIGFAGSPKEPSHAANRSHALRRRIFDPTWLNSVAFRRQ